MKQFLMLCTGLALSAVMYAQTGGIKGIAGGPDSVSVLKGATITLVNLKDTAQKKMITSGTGGVFSFSELANGSYTVTISFVGYRSESRNLNLSGNPINLGRISLERSSVQEETVKVVAQIPITVKGDTVQYSANQYKVNPDATSEDLIKKMPGITVDTKGNVTAQGEQVKKVTVDGRDFFGDDATAALRNLPAEVVDKIQVFDRLSDQAQFTGFDDGNSSKSINIVTKSGMRNGQFGRLFAGYGTDDRYSAGGNMSFFKNNRRISLVGMSNNINQQNFAQQDILGVTSSNNSGGRGGGAGGSRGGAGGGGNAGGNRGGGGSGNFMVGQQDGISSTNAFGINFSDVLSKKTEVSGSYFFNNNNTSNDQTTSAEYFQPNGKNQFYDESTLSDNKNYSNRINLRVEHKFNDRLSLNISPNLSFQNNRSMSEVTGTSYFSATEPISELQNSNDRKSSGYNIGGNILLRYAFLKKGRTLSVNLNPSFNRNDADTYTESNNTYFTTGGEVNDSLRQYSDKATTTRQWGGNISFTEPVGKKGQLQFNYSPSVSLSNSDQQTYQYDYTGGKYSMFDNNLSNKFDNTVTRHNTGISYRQGDRDNMFSVGLSYQYTGLNSEQLYPYSTTVTKSFNNLLPNLMWNKKLDRRNSIRIFYRTNTNAPSITQLQNVINNSNPLFLSTGNPDLKQQYGHTVAIRHTFTNTGKSKSLFANVFLQQNNNYITNATYTASADSVLNSSVTLFRGSQLTKPVNLDGYLSVRSFLTYALPVKAIKSNISLNGGFTWSRTPGLLNNVSNISNTYNYNTGLVVASNISQFVDFNLSYSANFNVVKNSIQPQLNNNYFSQNAGLQFNLLSKKGLFFQNDISNQTYKGLTSGFNQSFWLWNMSVGTKFMKDQKGEIKLSVFDLLKQNRSITRTATETYVEDVQNQVLTQYFMLTFTYKLKNFGIAKKATTGGERPGGMGGMPPF